MVLLPVIWLDGAEAKLGGLSGTVASEGMPSLLVRDMVGAKDEV